MRLLAITALAAVATACAGTTSRVSEFSRPLPRWDAPAPAAEDIVRVELDRLGDGWGTTPIYRLDLRRDGGSSYTGGPRALRQGQWVVPPDSAMFARLAASLVRGDFFHFDPRPAGYSGCADAVVLAVAVTLRSGQVHRIHDDCSSPELAVVAAQIDTAAALVPWLPAPAQAVPPN